ncbi:MAG: hypothetical protein V9G12_08075 [Microthrixaceae bacterium]
MSDGHDLVAERHPIAAREDECGDRRARFGLAESGVDRDHAGPLDGSTSKNTSTGPAKRYRSSLAWVFANWVSSLASVSSMSASCSKSASASTSTNELGAMVAPFTPTVR